MLHVVTGGAGFIGSNLAAVLAERGKSVVVVDNVDDEHKRCCLAKHPPAEVVPPATFLDWLADNGREVAVIFHMGATSSTTESDLAAVMDNNFHYSLALWRWCTAHGTPLIYASSAATYGDGSAGFDDDPHIESLSRLRPLNPYGWSKHLFDMNAVLFAAAGLAPPQWAGLKFFNAYGPNEYHKGPQQSVAVQLYEQIGKTGRARLFRSHHPNYADGGQMRDFVWVGDCVAIMLWLMETPAVSGLFNVGSGRARSFADLARACFAAMDRPPAIDYVDTPAHILQHYQYFTEARMSRIAEAGYRGVSTTLEDGVRRYVRDHLATCDRYR